MAALYRELDWRVQEELARPLEAPEKPGKSSRNGKAPIAKKPAKAKPASKKKVLAKSRR